MRSAFLLICVLTISFSSMALVGEKPTFKLDKVQAAEQFNELDQLEAFLLEHPGLTAADIAEKIAANDPTVSHINSELLSALAGPSPNSDYRDEFFNLPAFWFSAAVTCVGWCAGLGLVAGPIAVVYVYINSEHDGAATMESLAGCVAINFLVIGGYIGLILASNNGGW